ncbi:unnamed protein product [Acanthoscelides obtectus]|uniref:Peptidase S1 domain-containing protein n=1 Tax=Acanthoscelides obtectus TaxID=200917 RepID=A0A9P0P2T0_ACAOB|nr:unnamed protein product [Acanthoscelides obtectus]CAK1649407.1 hypothetical protein AOBTE_LOCUS16217 [Acanthoscelides obtectus]
MHLLTMRHLLIFFYLVYHCHAASIEVVVERYSKQLCLAEQRHIVGICSNDSYRLRCAGTLINESWVLTAAQCRKVDIVVAGISIQALDSLENVHVRNINYTLSHPLYETDGMNYDIQLIRLDEPIPESDNVKYVQLPTERYEDINERCESPMILGWGIMAKSSCRKKPPRLSCVVPPFIPLERCQMKYNDSSIIKSMCTSNKGEDETCLSDSGSPVMCGDIQFGIVSWGVGNHPMVHTRVDEYLEFISQVTGLELSLEARSLASRKVVHCFLYMSILAMFIMK